jgi:hypothetical protein
MEISPSPNQTAPDLRSTGASSEVVIGVVGGWLATFREALFSLKHWSNPKLALGTLLLITAVPFGLASALAAGAFVAYGQQRHARSPETQAPGAPADPGP